MLEAILTLTIVFIVGMLCLIFGMRSMLGKMSAEKKALYAKMPIFSLQMKLIGFIVFVIGLSCVVGTVVYLVGVGL